MLTIYVYYVKGEYSNRWGVEIKGDSNKAKRIAQEHGFIYVNEVIILLLLINAIIVYNLILLYTIITYIKCYSFTYLILITNMILINLNI